MRRARGKKQAEFSLQQLSEADCSGDALLARALRCVERGEDRRAYLLLEQACCVNDRDARVWTLFGIQCRRMTRYEDAQRALKQALWLRERERDMENASMLRRLLEELRQDLPAA